MYRQIRRLCRLQLGNLFGINEFRYTKDRAKKMRYLGLAVVWVLLIVMLVGYVTAYAAVLGWLGMAEIVPIYLYVISGILMLFFTFFKAGSVLFSVKGYEMLVSLPVSRAAVIISRFLSMYVTNLLLGLLIMIPGMVVCGCFIRPGAWFFVTGLLGTLFLPMLPLTVASIFGAAITAVSTRFRHKSIGETALMVLVVIATLAVSMTVPEQTVQMESAMIKDLAEILTEQLGSFYPPALWFQKALWGDFGAFALLLFVPTAIFAVFIAVLQKHFYTICAALCAVTAKNNYKMQELKTSGIVTALWKKELKRYFASSVYVTNTVVGHVMLVFAAAALLVIGPQKLEQMMAVSGVTLQLQSCIPYIMSCMMCMMPITAASISMEGNTFWQIQTLPVQSRDVYNSKILVNLTIAAPFYLVTEVLLCIAQKPTLTELLWMLVIPACYLVFVSVIGITINLVFPVFDWENEVRVVKQGAAMSIAMLVGTGSSVLPLIGIILAGEGLVNGIRVATILILAVLTIIFYQKNNKY